MTHRTFATIAAVALATFVIAAPHRISPAKAIQIAMAKYHGKLVGKPKLEHEDGAWQYEVFIRQGKILKEVNVNANTGKIGSVENTTAREEAREAKASHKGAKS